MSVLEFIAALFSSLSWPALVLALVLLFRNPLSELIGRLKSAKWGDKEAVFDRAAEALRENLDEIAQDTSDVADESSSGGAAAGLEPDGSPGRQEDTQTPWSRWARDPQERYARVLSKWRHPGRYHLLEQVAATMAAEGITEFPDVEPPRFIWYLNRKDPIGSSTQAFHDLTDWIQFIASLIGAQESADAKASLLHIAEQASLDLNAVMNAWRNLASMNLLVQAGRGDGVNALEAIRFVRAIEQFSQTLFEAVEPGLELVQAAFQRTVEEPLGEDQATQDEIDLLRGK